MSLRERTSCMDSGCSLGLPRVNARCRTSPLFLSFQSPHFTSGRNTFWYTSRVEEFYNYVRSCAYVLCRKFYRLDDVEDVAQEVFVRRWLAQDFERRSVYRDCFDAFIYMNRTTRGGHIRRDERGKITFVLAPMEAIAIMSGLEARHADCSWP